MDNNGFGSIDRLVEFGIGLAIAQQMVQTMNHAMNNMHIAGTMNALDSEVPSSFFVVFEDKQAGPFSETQMIQLISEKKITNESFIWYKGLKNWEKAENIPAILRLVALAPPPFKP